MNKFDDEINCQGLNCPLPILKTKKTIDGMESGKILKMTSTDPGSASDVDSWAKRTGNNLISNKEDNGVYTFFIKNTSIKINKYLLYFLMRYISSISVSFPKKLSIYVSLGKQAQ